MKKSHVRLVTAASSVACLNTAYMPSASVTSRAMAAYSSPTTHSAWLVPWLRKSSRTSVLSRSCIQAIFRTLYLQSSTSDHTPVYSALESRTAFKRGDSDDGHYLHSVVGT